MLTTVIKQLKTSLIMLILFSTLTGIIYPVLVTGIAQLLFSWRANGSLIEQDNKIVGSVLIGQSFTPLDTNSNKYFWSRPSATMPYEYNAQASSGSNMAPSNPAFLAKVSERVGVLQKLDPENKEFIPVDLVTASASGLDPEISPLAALYQVRRIAKARGIPESELVTLVQRLVQKRTFGILGEPRVNVLQLNMALDSLRATRGNSNG